MSRSIHRLFHFICRSRTQYTPLVSVRISADVLRGNLRAFQEKFPNLGIAPVLKSNAYGHGLREVARLFDRDALPFFAVDTYAEALILRNEGIRSPILILGYSLFGNILNSRLSNVAFTIASIHTLKEVAASGKPCECHMKIDTGMHRQGIAPEEIPLALEILKGAPALRVVGIFSHLADADGPDGAFTHAQVALWNRVVTQLKDALPRLQFIHCSATAGTRYADAIDANCMRLGIGLYGCTSTSPVSVSPALELVSLVSAIREIRKGERIGYHGTYTAPRDMRVATVPIGYAEGVDRRVSNTGVFLVHGALCAIVGRVSMNMTTLDVTDVLIPVTVGDEVVAISSQREDKNSCESIARMCGTIPYEILVHIPSTLRRNYY